ncbi:hypothetical protein J6O86_08705, partial [bacterium]|nr:hypothetical protein [bacterium]
DENEIKDILEQLTNLQFTDGAIKYIALRKVPFRQNVQTIQEIESYSQTNNISEINETKVIEVLNERQDSQIMSQNA